MKSIPKQIESVGNNFYMFNNEGMTWFNRNNGLVLTEYTDYKTYRPLMTVDERVNLVNCKQGRWSGGHHILKTNS